VGTALSRADGCIICCVRCRPLRAWPAAPGCARVPKPCAELSKVIPSFHELCGQARHATQSCIHHSPAVQSAAAHQALHNIEHISTAHCRLHQVYCALGRSARVHPPGAHCSQVRQNSTSLPGVSGPCSQGHAVRYGFSIPAWLCLPIYCSPCAASSEQKHA
jgi:hypothetical protein